MALDKYVEQNFGVCCRGRDRKGTEVLETPVNATVTIYQRAGNDKDISSIVDCKYNAGAHGETCMADYRRQNYCPYSFDLPFALERKEEE